MAAKILNAKLIADEIKAEVKTDVKTFEDQYHFRPCLTAIRVGQDPASEIYVNNKVRTAAELGIDSRQHHLPAETTDGELSELINELNSDVSVDGVLVQLPLPRHINERDVFASIDPAKDVDGFHPVNVGNLSLGYSSPVPCTPAGVIEILKRSGIEIDGKHAVIVGRSNIVGKPLATLLLRENATVTICHSRTKDLSVITRQADILVPAIGSPAFIRAEHIREGATVIDVGINKVENQEAAKEYFDGEELEKRLAAIEKRGFTLVGDVHPRDAQEKAGKLTAVPGGVGLLTVAMLMKNAVTAAKARRILNKPRRSRGMDSH